MVDKRKTAEMPIILFRDKGTSWDISSCSLPRVDNRLLGEAPANSLIGVVTPLPGSKPGSAYNEASAMEIDEDPMSVDLERKDSICMDEEHAVAEFSTMAFHQR